MMKIKEFKMEYVGDVGFNGIDEDDLLEFIDEVTQVAENYGICLGGGCTWENDQENTQ